MSSLASLRVCSECGSQHSPSQPHDPAKKIYRQRFVEKNGRFPTWEDALAHCTDQTKDLWRKELKKSKIDPKSAFVNGGN